MASFRKMPSLTQFPELFIKTCCMVFIYFSGISPSGDLGDYSYGGPTLESCFNVLNGLVDSGWQLVRVILLEHAGGQRTELPVEAFDGTPMEPHLDLLKRTWTALLDRHDYYTKAFARSRTMSKAIKRSKLDHERIDRKMQSTNKRVVALFEKMDALQDQIEYTKAKWHIV